MLWIMHGKMAIKFKTPLNNANRSALFALRTPAQPLLAINVIKLSISRILVLSLSCILR